MTIVVNVERFPALRGLAPRRRREIPHVPQMQATDCAAACLTMVLRHLGRNATLDEVRAAAGSGRDGASGKMILDGAEAFGLRGRGVKLEVEDLVHMPMGTILHWEFKHFVVLERMTRRGARIVDPGRGRRMVPLEKLRRSFTGIALVLEPTDAFVRGGSRSRRSTYLEQLLSHRDLLTRVLVSSLTLRLFALALPLLTGLLVDRVVPRSDRDLLLVVGVGLGLVFAFDWLTSLVRAHLLLELRTKLDTKLTLGFLDYLVSLPYAFFQVRSAGDLMMRVNSNATIRELLTANTLSALLDGTLVLSYVGLVLVVSPGLGALVLGIGAVQVLVFLLTRGRYRDLMAENLDEQAKSQSYLVQIMRGIETLKACGAEHRAVERWSHLFVNDLNVALQRGRLSAMVDSFRTSFQRGAPLLVLGVGAVQVIDGQLTLGAMLAVNALAIGFLTPLSSLVESGYQLQLLGGYLARIDDVMSAEPEQRAARAVAPPRLSGRISLSSVGFRYAPTSPLVVSGVSLELEPGRCVAVVGRSGSGKSTLAKLMMGLYHPTDGRVLYDGLDLAELDLRAVRRQLGVVPQTPYLVGGASIRDNIALVDPETPLSRVIEAAKLACIHDDIMAMPMGYETLVNDAGLSLSGGQRQRIALARALIHRPSILLLDEATSALDTTTESEVMRNLDRLRCTRVIVAHRLSTIVRADAILVLDHGRVVEHGTHHELVHRPGVYQELVVAQAELAR